MNTRGMFRGLLALAAAAWAPVASANLITNGDFSAGNAGFASGYTYVSPTPNTSCWPEGTYTVGTDPNACHYLWTSFGDHTSGAGNMMIVNGAPSANVSVWSESSIGVQANTQYTFTGWVASTYPSSPASLNFFIDGAQVGAFTSSTAPGQWQQFSASWFSGTNTSATLSIFDQNLDRGGNDFALDDLSFDAVPEPNAALWLMGALVLVVRQRSRRALVRQRY